MTRARKAVLALWAEEGRGGDLLAKPLLADVGPRLADAGATRAEVGVSDSGVSSAMLRLTAFDSPVDAVISVWVPDVDDVVDRVVRVLTGFGACVEGWLVEEESTVPPPDVPLGERLPGLTNVTFLRRPDEMSYDRWLRAWDDHTALAVAHQGTMGHVRNLVVGPATQDAPPVDAVVEEVYPIEALTDPHAFYGSRGDGHELWRRATRLLESSASIGTDRRVDVVPTSRFRVL